MCLQCLAIERWFLKMDFDPLLWYSRPIVHGFWKKADEGAFNAYASHVIDSIVVCISHLVLLGLCCYRIWLIKMDSKVQRFCLKSNYYNYMLGLLACYCTAEPLFRLVMGVSILDLDGQTGIPLNEVRFPFPLFSWFMLFSTSHTENELVSKFWHALRSMRFKHACI